MASATEVIERSGLDLNADEFVGVAFRPMPAIMHCVLRSRASAITIGSTVFFDPKIFDEVVAGCHPDLVAHELLHTVQWKTDGVAFIPRYVSEYLRLRLVGATHDAAYRSISYEIAAYEVGSANRRSPV